MSQALSGSGAINGIDDMTKSMRDGMAKAMTMPQKMLEAHLATSSELFNFISRRIQAQAELLDTISHCADIDDAASAQNAFFEKAAVHYGHEMSQLMEITRKNLSMVTDALIEPPNIANPH